MAGLSVTGPCLIYVGLGVRVRPVSNSTPAEAAAALGNLAGAGAGAGLPGGLAAALAAGGAGNNAPRLEELEEQPVFLGTCERGPRTLHQAYWSEVFQDDYGHRVPTDLVYDSEEAYVFAEVNRFNEAVLSAVQERMYTQSRSPFPNRGFEDDLAVGTLAKAERKAYAVWLAFPYAAKLVNLLSGLPANFCFPACVCWGPDEQDPLGSRPRKVRLVWRAIRHRNEQLGGSYVYFHDANPLPPPD